MECKKKVVSAFNGSFKTYTGCYGNILENFLRGSHSYLIIFKGGLLKKWETLILTLIHCRTLDY